MTRHHRNICEHCGEHTRCLGESVDDIDGNQFCSDECMREYWDGSPEQIPERHVNALVESTRTPSGEIDLFKIATALSKAHINRAKGIDSEMVS